MPDVAVTRERLKREWELAQSVFKPAVLERLSLCIGERPPFTGIPRDPDPEIQAILTDVIERERVTAGPARATGDAQFVVFKVLLHHRLTNGEAVTTEWLMRTCGYSYPTVAGVLNRLGSLIERSSDRRLRLRWFPREEFVRLLSLSDSARATVRFADRSGQNRSPEMHLRRLEKLAPEGIGIGGVLGARHYLPNLDLVGIPRLDLSEHCFGKHLDLGFVEDLDPALTRVEDPLAPATVVVHAVRHANPLFINRKGGLNWADPVECLLDLHEARLDLQASQLLDALQDRRPHAP
jgi:hypothetical protein